MAAGGLHAYREALKLHQGDPPFSALIFAAMLKADDDNTAKLTSAFPELRAELTTRYWAAGGLLPEEAPPWDMRRWDEAENIFVDPETLEREP
jgi:hypothetical protein